MTLQKICNTLVAKGFSNKDSEILAKNLISMDERLLPLLSMWIESGVESDFESNGMSIRALMDYRNLQYQAALLTMDWIIKEPTVAIEVIKRGVR